MCQSMHSTRRNSICRRMSSRAIILMLVLAICCPLTAQAQSNDRGRVRYITNYADMAQSLTEVQRDCRANNITTTCATIVIQDNIIYPTGAWQQQITTNINVVGQCLGGKPCSIDGNRMARHFLVVGENSSLLLQNLQLQNGLASSSIGGIGAAYGGSLQISSSARVSAVNVMFLSNAAGQGGAVSVFADGLFTANNCVFEGNTADAGGAVQVAGATATMDNSVFTNNQASQGGAVYAEGTARVTITNSGFRNNQAQQVGPDVFIKYDEPVVVQTAPYPPLFNVSNGNAQRLDSNKTAQPIRPLPSSIASTLQPYPQLTTTLTVTPSPSLQPLEGEIEVWNETALIVAIQGRASSIALMAHIVLTGLMPSQTEMLPYVQNSVLIRGYCTSLGGKCTLQAQQLRRIFHVVGAATLTLERIRLAGGFAPEDKGGAILVDVGGSLAMTDVIVEDCQAQEGGGIATVGAASLTCTNCLFRRNVGYSYGGAVQHSGVTAEFSACSFDSNRADYGGGLDLRGSSSATFISPLFSNNFVNQAGADVFVESPTTSQLLWQPYPVPSSYDVQPVGFAQPVGTTNADLPPFVYSPPPPPPAQEEFVGIVVQPLYQQYQPPPPPPLLPSATVTVYSQEDLIQALLNNVPVIAIASHMVLTGGAVDALVSILPDIITTTTIFGTCKDWGGRCTIDAKGNGRILSVTNLNAVPILVRLINLRFNNGQTQALTGGALYTMGQVVLQVDNCEFNSNFALDGGAVMLSSQGGATFTHCFFSDNHIAPATEVGAAGTSTGGAVLAFTEVCFIETNFAHNSAKDGGAVGLDIGARAAYFEGCTFDGNWADRYGPDVFVRSTFDTAAYFQPWPTTAIVYSQDAAKPLLPSSPTGPSPPLPPAFPVEPRKRGNKQFMSPGAVDPSPSPPPPPPPSPGAPAAGNDTTLWELLQSGQSFVNVTSHMVLADASEWAEQGPMEVSGNLALVGACGGPTNQCVVDASGLLPALFVVQNGKLHLENLRIMGTAPPQNWQVRPLGPLTNRRRRLHSAIRSEDILSAVVLLGNVQAQFINVDFVGNTGTYGGAVSIDGTLGPVTAHFINCTFTKNVASVWGGAMLVKQGNAVIQSSQLVFNKATQGGAIALDSGANVSSIWTSYAGNLATQGGDDVYLSDPGRSKMACHTYPCPGLDVEPAWATWDSAIDWVPAVSGEQFVLGGLTGLSDSSNFTGVGTVKLNNGWYEQLMLATGPSTSQGYRYKSPTPPLPYSPAPLPPLPSESDGFPFGTGWKSYSTPALVMMLVFVAGMLSVCTVFCCARRAFAPPAKWFDVEDYLTHPLAVDGGLEDTTPHSAYDSTLRAGVEVVEVVDDGASDVASTSESQTSGTSTARMSMLSSVAALWTARHRGGRKQNTGGPQPIRTNREPVVMEPTAVIMDTESPLARAGPNATAVTGESAALGGTPRKRGLHDIHTMQQ